ncbi:MAG: hypothetical protein HFH41_13410 [Lachnospiraceae bacterium]|nr:hypothetical protein [Lachnospiraceae bacterium]
MLLIIAHHFVVNSGVQNLYDFSHITPNMIFLQLFGMWGKAAINIFILISGYFMCVSELKVKQIGKIYLETKFYMWIIFLIFLISGYEIAGKRRVFELLFGLFQGIGNNFTASFLIFYIFVPFYNILINHISEHQYKCFVILLIFVNVITETFFFSNIFCEPLWYASLYFVAAYIRKHPLKWMNRNGVVLSLLIGAILLSYASVILVDFFGVKYGFTSTYYMVADSNKALAFLVSIFVFLLFKNMEIRYNSIINHTAAATYGVLCIHASSDAMRKFLWVDFFNVSGHYSCSLIHLILYSFSSVLCVFIVCSFIDMLRIQLIERPLFKFLEKCEWWNKPLFLE